MMILTKTKNERNTTEMSTLVEKVSPLYGSQIVGSLQLKKPVVGGIKCL